MKSSDSLQKTILLSQLLEFEIIFPEERRLTAENYLKGAHRNLLLKAAAFFLSFKVSKSIYNDNQTFFSNLFRSENQIFASLILEKISQIEKKGNRVTIINTYASLKLFETIFSMVEGPIFQSEEEIERNLFKAYLSINSEFTQIQQQAFETTKNLEAEIKVPMIAFCMHYPIADKVGYNLKNIWVTQIIKAVLLFDFLEKNHRTKHLFESFLVYFDCSNWQEYLKKLIPITTFIFTIENEAQTELVITSNEKYQESCDFLEKSILKTSDPHDNNDFKTLRASPLYKIEEGRYGIIYDLFVVEKIFKGIYFLLKEVNESLPKHSQVPNLKSIYGYEFSEKTLLYQVVDIIYPNKCIKFSGDDLDKKGLIGSPDYYIRKGKHILLFESKDFLIRADLKTSFDFSIYQQEFSKILYNELLPDGKMKFGAILQLINNIKKLLTNEFQPDTDYFYRDMVIYPILVTHDHQYDVPGFADFVNVWFNIELTKLKDIGKFVNRIKPITVINIDSLILHQTSLLKNMQLHKILDNYHEHVKIKQGIKFDSFSELMSYRLEKMIPFSNYITKFLESRNLLITPPLRELIGPSLFKDEWLE